MTDYLTVAEVLAMHADQIERYGGSPGIRDQGLLEAALYRPQTGYYADLIEEAAALWESLSQNQSFVDGNKRTAFAATYTFLAINGLYLTADAAETYVFISNLYKANEFRFDKLVPLATCTCGEENLTPMCGGSHPSESFDPAEWGAAVLHPYKEYRTGGALFGTSCAVRRARQAPPLRETFNIVIGLRIRRGCVCSRPRR